MNEHSMKVILVLLDGLGDRTYPELGHRTPLAAADTPNLNRLSKMGSNGTFHALAPGHCLPSETAHYLMFGYDITAFPGRGLLEAVGEDVPFDDPDVLVLAHLSHASVSSDGIVRLAYGRDEIPGDRDFLEPFYRQLTPFQHGGVAFELHQTGRNDAILVLKGDVSPDISDSDPIQRNMPVGRVVPLAETNERTRAEKTADAMNRYLAWCHHRLKEIKGTKPGKRFPGINITGNFLLTQRAGRKRVQKRFSEKWGFSPALIASGGVYRGLARELGFDFIQAADTPSPGKDLAGRIQTALDDTAHNFIHVHTKVPDEISHKGDPVSKTAAISALDSGFSGLVRAIETKTGLLAVITADHSTPSRSPQVHSGETVPIVMAGGAIRKDTVDRFDEVSAVSGSLGFMRGDELMHMILNCSDRAVLHGLRLGPERQPSLDAAYPPLLVESPGKRSMS